LGQLTPAEHAARFGFRPLRSEVIPNGFDTELFRPSPEAAAAVRAELDFRAGRRIVGLVSRYHPMKCHASFLEAARVVLEAGADVAFLCAGTDVTPGIAALREQISRLGLTSRVHLLGERGDMPRLFAAFDVTCGGSGWGEGFLNVVRESMACATPSVATDIGDSRRIVGGAGVFVPPGKPGDLA